MPDVRAHTSQRLTGQQGGVAAAGREADDPEPPGVAPHDVSGLGPDRPGRAEQDDVTAWFVR